METLSCGMELDGPSLDRGRLLISLLALGDKTKIPSILGWAAQKNMPSHAALAALASDLPFWQRRRAAGAAADLAAGTSLSSVLDRHLPNMTPHFYRVAVRKAEEDNCLEEMLPALANNVRYHADIVNGAHCLVAYPVLQMLNAMALVFMVYAFILPRFDLVMCDLTDDGPLPWLFESVMAVSRMVSSPGSAAVVLIALTAPVLLVAGKILPFRTRIVLAPFQGAFLLLANLIPFVGGQIRRIAFLDAVGAMAALTGAGYDVAQAARWNARAVFSARLRRKLAAFAEAVERGEPWACAWENMKIGTPGNHWVIHNAAARESPQDGFQTLAAWLDHDIRQTHAVLVKFSDVFKTLFCATIIGVTVVAVWQALLEMGVGAMVGVP